MQNKFAVFQAYVPKVSGSEKYRTYLSLMPEDVEGGNENTEEEEEEEEAATKRSQILSEFRALSYEEQMNQRIRLVASFCTYIQYIRFLLKSEGQRFVWFVPWFVFNENWPCMRDGLIS